MQAMGIEGTSFFGITKLKWQLLQSPLGVCCTEIRPPEVGGLSGQVILITRRAPQPFKVKGWLSPFRSWAEV